MKSCPSWDSVCVPTGLRRKFECEGLTCPGDADFRGQARAGGQRQNSEDEVLRQEKAASGKEGEAAQDMTYFDCGGGRGCVGGGVREPGPQSSGPLLIKCPQLSTLRTEAESGLWPHMGRPSWGKAEE